MVVRKCSENDKDAIRWCIAKPDKRKSRKISGKIFTAKLYKDMDWNADCRYKILGYRITFEGETIYIFDLTETEVFLNLKKSKNTEDEVPATEGAVVSMSDEQAEAIEQATVSRKGYMPEQWENSYGLPVEEHRTALRVDIREGYAQYDMFSFTNPRMSNSAFTVMYFSKCSGNAVAGILITHTILTVFCILNTVLWSLT